jgi:hypothetical protein
VSKTRGVERENRAARVATPIAQIDAMINPTAHDCAIGEFGPISPSDDARITRSDMQNAIGIAAKWFVLRAPIHEVSTAPACESAEKTLRLSVVRVLAVHTVERMPKLDQNH